MHDEDVRLGCDKNNRCEILDRIEAESLIEAYVRAKRRVVAGNKRVAVGRRFRGKLGADVPAGAGPVLDDHRLSHALLQLLADEAREYVGGTAGQIGCYE